MNVKNEKLFFSLKNENGVVYQHEISLLDFQFETIKNENVKLYYTLKDIAFDLEEKINLKLKLSGNKIDTEFSIFLSEKNRRLIKIFEIHFGFILLSVFCIWMILCSSIT